MADYSERSDLFSKKFQQFVQLLTDSRRIRVFTGAGVSTLSGIPDFRGAHGIYTDPWHGMDVEQILSIDFFAEHPDVFYKWAKDVWYGLENYQPNIVHKTVADLESKHYIDGVYTQNIDMLHQRAGSKVVYEVHGSPMHHYCRTCGAHYSYEEIAPIVRSGKVPTCKRCGGVIKPDIVFYGENLNESILHRAWEEFSHADLCLVFGSSLTVQPAASFPRIAVESGAKLVIVNAQRTYLDQLASLRFTDLQQFCEALDLWIESNPPRKG